MHAFLSLTSKDDLGPVHTYPYSFEKPFFSPFSKKFASTRNVFARPHVQANSADNCLHFSSLAYDLTHRTRGRKYELNVKVEGAD